MYREAPTFELRCPRGHLHKDPCAEGAYCAIAPCRGITDWYGDRHGTQVIRKVFPLPVKVACEEHQHPQRLVAPPPLGRRHRVRLALAALWRWAFPPPPACEDCQEVLRGPEIEYSGRGIRRLHFGTVCIACHLKRVRKDDLEFIASMRK